MITGINFGGLGKPTPKTKPLIAPIPLEYAKPQTLQVIKNHTPKPQ